MARKPYRSARSLSAEATDILDPLMRKRAGINVELFNAWDDIVGEQLAETTQPLKILWPRNSSQTEHFEPATLVVACQGFAAMKLSHESSQLVNRVNAFFGYNAISRLKIEQRVVECDLPIKETKIELEPEDKGRIANQMNDIEDDRIRDALQQLGEGILRRQKEMSNKKFNK